LKIIILPASHSWKSREKGYSMSVFKGDVDYLFLNTILFFIDINSKRDYET